MESTRMHATPPQPQILTPGLDHAAVINPPPSCAQAVASAEHRTNGILTYLWDQRPDDVLAGDVVIEHDLRSGHSNTTPYLGVCLDGITHHVWARGTPPPVDLHDLGRVVVLGGICLWSASTAWAITAGHRRVPITGYRGRALHHRKRNRRKRIIAVDANPAPTFPEVEGSLRLGTFCAGLAARIPRHVPVVARLDSPYLSYPLYALQAALDGLMPARLLAKWTDLDFARHHGVVRRHARVVRAAMAGRRPVRLDVRPELTRVALHLRADLARGRVTPFEELVDLASQEGQLWKELIALEPPSTPLDLGYLTYIAAALRAGEPVDGRPTLVVIADDPAEWRILERTRKLARQMGTGLPPLGLHPLSRFWVNAGEKSRPDLYAHDPGRYAIDEDGRYIDLFDLGTSLYTPSLPAL
ncbi:hypothetical protein ABZ897_57940 [Nonomuraea sp. NPDC046802]|uniref:hypothetical protein n=1 Tax=Nonomuraea sp. NPDC046802 TaxID=3154919 RepID=UPI00340FDA45